MLLLAVAPIAAPAPAFSFDDYAKIVGLSDPRIAPDGKRVVLVVSHTDVKKDSRSSELVLVDIPSGRHRVITHDRDEVGSPQWSPDGTQLAFIAAAGSGKEARAQVWVLPMNGGDARVVTQAKNGVDAYAWRPDGKALAYVSSDDPANAAAIARHEDLFTVGNDSFMTRAIPPPSHLWLQPLDGGNAQRLTEGSWSVSPEALSWSHDGRYLAFERLPGPRFDDILHARVAVVEPATRTVREVSRDSWALDPAFSPAGEELAYTQAPPNTFVTQQNPATIDVTTNVRRDPAPKLDRDVTFLAWMPDGKTLAVAANDRIARGLWFVRDGTAHRVDLGNVNFEDGSIARDGGLAFVGSTSSNPGELYYLPPKGGALVKLTDFNADIARLHLAPAREFSWQNAGFTEYGVLTSPVNYRPGKKYPLVLVIHGGPTSEASTSSFDPLVQMLAVHGAFVLQPNYRGSDDFGFKYAYAIVGDEPPLGAGEDCVAAVKALEATGTIDPAHVGVSGWSAGGWLTSWLIGHYDLWKAAVSGAAVDDVVLQYSLSQIDSYMPYLFNGTTPWKGNGMAIYRRSSPITYAANVKAATLILSDTGDPRVPTPEAYEFYTALRDLGKTVEFVAIPATGHHPSDPVRSRAVDEVWVNWMVKYVPLP